MRIQLHTQIFIAMAIGVVVGWVFPELAPFLKPIGDIFIRLLKFLIVPLVLASLVLGVVSLGDVRHLGRLGVKTMAYFLVTTMISVSIGITIATFFEPGANTNLAIQQSIQPPSELPSVADIVVQIVPKNLLKALVDSEMLAIIFTAIFMGVGLAKMGDKGEPLAKVFKSINDLMMVLTGWVIALSPIGVFALMVVLVSGLGLSALIAVSKYILCVAIGLVIHATLVVPGLAILFAKKSPHQVLRPLSTALMTAFSTASSAAALPILMKALTEKLNVSSRVTSFVIPLGITVNMDGTALYQAVATLFIAQFYGIQLGMMHFVLIVFTAVLASVGAAAIPSAGLITLALILTTVGVPTEGVALIIGVDRLVDMMRTTVNLWANANAAMILAVADGETL